MRQSLMLEGLKRSKLNAAKRSKRRDVGRKYDLLHQSTYEDEGEIIHSRQQHQKNQLAERLQLRLAAAEEYIDLLQSQTLNYRVYIKNLELTEDQLCRTNRLAEDIRRNESQLMTKKDQYDAMRADSSFSTTRNKQNIVASPPQRFVTFHQFQEERPTLQDCCRRFYYRQSAD